LLKEKDIFPVKGFPCNQMVFDPSIGCRVMVKRDDRKKISYKDLSEETEKVSKERSDKLKSHHTDSYLI